MKELQINKNQMTVLDVAAALKVTDRTVRRYVDKLFPDLMENGQVTRLDEKQVTAIKLDLEKNKHLDTSVQLPKTELEKKLLIQQAMGFLVEEVEELKAQVNSQKQELIEAQPKIEFSERVEKSITSISVGEFAKLLSSKGVKTGQNKLFNWMRNNKYLTHDNQPYQRFVNHGYFEIDEFPFEDVAGNERIGRKTLITGKGQIYFSKRIAV